MLIKESSILVLKHTPTYMASIQILNNNLNFKHGQDVHPKNADMHCKIMLMLAHK